MLPYTLNMLTLYYYITDELRHYAVTYFSHLRQLINQFVGFILPRWWHPPVTMSSVFIYYRKSLYHVSMVCLKAKFLLFKRKGEDRSLPHVSYTLSCNTQGLTRELNHFTGKVVYLVLQLLTLLRD